MFNRYSSCHAHHLSLACERAIRCHWFWRHFVINQSIGVLTLWPDDFASCKSISLTCRSNSNSSHLSCALHDLYPFPSVFMRPLRPVAFITPFIGRRHSGNHQFKHAVLAGNQSDASVGIAPGELWPRRHVSLRPKCQNVLRRSSLLHRPGDGQVGGMGELPGDVAGQREVTSFWDDGGWGLGGDLEGVGDDWRENGQKNKKKKTY